MNYARTAMASLAIVLSGMVQLEAGIITLNPVSENSAVTTTGGSPLFLDPIGGGFVPVGVGAVSDLHSAFQFDLSSLHGFTILSATLSLGANSFSGGASGDGTSSFNTSVSGFTGTGTVALSDFSAAPLFTAGAFPESATWVNNLPTAFSITPISQDVLSFINTEVTNSVQFGEFRLDPINIVAGPNFQVNFANAVLTVNTQDVASVPEPSTIIIWSLMAGVIGVGGIRKRLTTATAAA